jgi:hypothetical protein
MRPLLYLIAILLLPALAACNQVYSRTPLVPEAHEGGDPEFRPGLWKIGDDSDGPFKCPFDIRKHLHDWPDCAVAAEFRRGQMFLLDAHHRYLAQAIRMVDGPQILVQSHWMTDVLIDPRAPEPKDTDNPFYGWTYAAVTVQRMDQDGHIMQAEMVQADCGPLPSVGDPLPLGRKTMPMDVTWRPFAGLTLNGKNCVAKDLETVKTAIAESAKLGPAVPMRWIRDDP